MAVMTPEENPAHYKALFTVTEKEVDDNNHHLNNVHSVQWIQDISLEHSAKCGGTKVMEDMGASWMITTHHIDFKAQAFIGDVIEGETWVPEYARISTNRHCKFTRVSDGKVIFQAVTTWVLMDVAKGRPVAIPENLKDCFRNK